MDLEQKIELQVDAKTSDLEKRWHQDHLKWLNQREFWLKNDAVNVLNDIKSSWDGLGNKNMIQSEMIYFVKIKEQSKLEKKNYKAKEDESTLCPVSYNPVH